MYLNDTAVTLGTLAQVAGGLVDISGQHEHYSLLRTEFHLDLLDRMAGFGGLRAEVAAAYEAQAEVEAALTTLLEAQRQKGERLEVLRCQRQELAAAELKDPPPPSRCDRFARRAATVSSRAITRGISDPTPQPKFPCMRSSPWFAPSRAPAHRAGGASLAASPCSKVSSPPSPSIPSTRLRSDWACSGGTRRRAHASNFRAWSSSVAG